MKIGVPKETAANERRVALTPDVAGRLVKSGFEVIVEQGAGTAAYFPDGAYQAAGAGIGDRAAVLSESAIVVQVQPPNPAELTHYREGSVLVAFFQPASELVRQLAHRKLTAFTLVLLPRNGQRWFLAAGEAVEACARLGDDSELHHAVDDLCDVSSTGDLTAPHLVALTRAASVLMAAGTVAFASGCGDDAPDVKDGFANLRAIHLVEGGPALEVVLDQSVDATAEVEFMDSSDYASIAIGTYAVTIRGPGGEALLNTTIELANVQSYTLVIFGEPKALWNAGR